MTTIYPRTPPNRGKFLYIIKMRRRHQGLTCGKWQRWMGIRYCSDEQSARTYLGQQVQSAVQQAAIFYRGKILK